MKKSSAKTAEDKKFLWYHLSLPHTQPHGIQLDPQAISGSSRLRLLQFQQSHSERNSMPSLSLPRTNRQLSGNAIWYVLVFIIVLRIFPTVYHFRECKSMHKSEKIPVIS